MATIIGTPNSETLIGTEFADSISGLGGKDVLNGLAGKHPETQGQLFAEDGELNRFVNVYVNDEDVRVQQGLETGVTAGDTVVILPAMAGGAQL